MSRFNSFSTRMIGPAYQRAGPKFSPLSEKRPSDRFITKDFALSSRFLTIEKHE